MSITQENRILSIETPLGKDVLLLVGLSGTEGISMPFSFELQLASEKSDISFKDIIGNGVTVSIVLANGSVRYFNGIISRFSQERIGATVENLQLAYYSATMVPWSWYLTRTVNSRIFQNLSVPKIVEKIFHDKGFNDFQMRLSEQYTPWDYCVQYHETDFQFVTRLLEQEGIYYFYEHRNKNHTLVLADSPKEHKPCPQQDTARCQLTEGGIEDEDVINTLGWMQEIRFGKYTTKDYNFLMPVTNIQVEVPTKISLGQGDRELYDFPGEYETRNEGEQYANIRMQAEEAQVTILSGTSNCRAFASGYRFTLQDYTRNELNNKPYVLTSVSHGATEPIGGSGEGSTVAYSNSFTCIPLDVPYRPPLITPKPVIAGVQTAIVTGPAGEEIYTDEHGRVKVQFHWDREGKNDENATCWIRVSQLWAGANWGAMFIPRIGHEVIVSFIEGDPDRPIITGRVYHGNNMPPYKLPDEKTKSTIMSRTTPRGQTYNELLMEDLSEKTRVVLSNAYGHKITEDEETQTLTIETRDKHMIIMDDKNKNIIVQTTKAHKLLFDDQNKKIVLNSTDGHTVELDDQNKKIQAVTKEGHTMLFDDQNKKISVTSKDGHTIVLDDDSKKMGATSKKGHYLTIDDSGDSITLEDSGGMHRFKIDITGSKLIIATDSGSINLEASAGKISLNSMDVEIKATNTIKLSGGMSGEFDGGLQAKVKGVQTSVEGAAMTEVKGALVKIN